MDATVWKGRSRTALGQKPGSSEGVRSRNSFTVLRTASHWDE